MAKQIKAIQCPKCGSTDKKELKPDYFHCNNCNTEYFLDNDDININHNVNYQRPSYTAPTPQIGKKKSILFIGLGIAMFFLIFVLPRLFSSSSKSVNSYTTLASGAARWWSWKIDFLAIEGGKPVMIVVGKRSLDGEDDVSSLAFIDLEKKKEIKVQKLGTAGTKASDDMDLSHFSNGDVYVIVDKMKIYKINNTDYTINDVTTTLFAQHPEMASGIANAEFMYKSDGEGFKVINNEGRNYFYYPMVDQLLTKEQKYAAEDVLESKVAGEQLVTAYKFTRSSSRYPETGIQLMQYTKKDNAGGVDDEPTFEWNDTYRSGAQQKTIIQFGQDLIRSYKDFTPERKYFNPEVQYFDKEVVIFSMANTPAENAPKSLQCLNATTAAVLWTLPIEDRYIRKIVPYKDGYMVSDNSAGLLISKDGKLKSEYKLN